MNAAGEAAPVRSIFETVRDALGEWDLNELKRNFRVLRQNKYARYGGFALFVAVFFSRPRPQSGAVYSKTDMMNDYAVGYNDAVNGRAYGTALRGRRDVYQERAIIIGHLHDLVSKESADASEAFDDVVDEVLRENPAEPRGARDEWDKRTGWNRREDTRAGKLF
ncbi:hypothetical protein M885DRAFT_515074 [Pelagophyceae sp. CCMP2097]|nr:hypothetical protein M885DRAFT_515074 [Pelagophyceae sp. CCMP2097]